MKFKPLDDKILVKPTVTSGEQKSKGGIIIPDGKSGKNAPMSGVIAAVGNDEELAKVLKEGDTVFYMPQAAMEMVFDHVTYHLLPRDIVLGSVEK